MTARKMTLRTRLKKKNDGVLLIYFLSGKRILRRDFITNFFFLSFPFLYFFRWLSSGEALLRQFRCRSSSQFRTNEMIGISSRRFCCMCITRSLSRPAAGWRTAVRMFLVLFYLCVFPHRRSHFLFFSFHVSLGGHNVFFFVVSVQRCGLQNCPGCVLP